MYLFIAGIFIMILGLLIYRQHPRKWKNWTSLLYIVGFTLILYAIYAMHDPIDGIPDNVMSFIQIIATVSGFYGLLYKIEHDMRSEFEDKLTTRLGEIKQDLTKQITELKTDLRRDIDRIEQHLIRMTQKGS
ncbi:TMEM134 family protein [Candidatus Bathyarchaeota archaeon]|nr:TMEM134 family protein [Candidatus Bathyarchaeota archaeon]